MKTCTDCSAFKLDDEEDEEPESDAQGECRLHAPTGVSRLSHGYSHPGWPEVRADDWCLEFRPKAVPPRKKS